MNFDIYVHPRNHHQIQVHLTMKQTKLVCCRNVGRESLIRLSRVTLQLFSSLFWCLEIVYLLGVRRCGRSTQQDLEIL